MTDIVERLRAYAEINEHTGAYTEANCAFDAIAEIVEYAVVSVDYDATTLANIIRATKQDSLGLGIYAGPISMGMIVAGLALAVAGRNKQYKRTGK